MRSSNPFLQENNQENQNVGSVYENTKVDFFTKRGALSKTILGLVVMIALIIFFQATNLVYVFAGLYGIISIGLIIAMIWMSIKARQNIGLAKNIFWVYVVCESMLLSVLITAADMYYPGIGTLAGIITIMLVFSMAILYSIAPNLIGKLQPLVFLGIIFVGVIYLINLFVIVFTGANMPIMYSMGFSIILLLISMFTVATDFRAIDIFEKQGLDKKYEWMGALGLITSIVWLYYNVLRVLLVSRRR